MNRFEKYTKPERRKRIANPRVPERSVEEILRDIAYVLHLTEMVRDQIITEREARDILEKAPIHHLCC